MYSQNIYPSQVLPSLPSLHKIQKSRSLAAPHRSAISIQELLCPMTTPSQRCKKLPGHRPTLRGPWHYEEDKLLTHLVDTYGAKNWSDVAAHMRGRTGKQVRERWVNQLNPVLKKKNWTAWEDRTILSAHNKLGNKWSAISRLLPGRTDNAVKNRYNSTLTRVMREREGVDGVVACLHVGGSSDGGEWSLCSSVDDGRQR